MDCPEPVMIFEVIRSALLQQDPDEREYKPLNQLQLSCSRLSVRPQLGFAGPKSLRRRRYGERGLSCEALVGIEQREARRLCIILL